MGIAELFILAAGLSMDAFAVSVCKGLALRRAKIGHMLWAGLWFGGFQAAMPVIGYLLGVNFQGKIQSFDHWIAFILLSFIGANMIKEALSKDTEKADASMKPKNMLLLAVATSIDALAVGVTFAFLKINIVPAVALIGIVTFLFSAAGIKIGSIFGTKYKSKAEFAGGMILILLGVKILAEHLFFS